MTLGGELDAGLAPGSIRAERDGVIAEVDVEDVDRLGARIRSVRVTSPVGVEVGTHASRLPDATRVLPDRIVPVEVAPSLGGAVLRSDPRHVRDREFFEVRTSGRVVDVERVRATETGREATGFTVTRDQLRRLVDDLGESFRDG